MRLSKRFVKKEALITIGDNMPISEKRLLSHRLLLSVAVLCFGFGYTIGCVEKDGDPDAGSGVRAGSGPITTGQNGRAGSNATDIATADSAAIAAGQNASAGSNTTDVARAESGPIDAGREGSSGSNSNDGAGGTSAGAGADAIAGMGGNSIIGVPPVIDVISGGGYVCLLKKDGSIVCWGDNYSGLPEKVPSGTFKQVSAVTAHACALKEDDSVVCWGVSGQNEVSYAGPFTQVSVGSLSKIYAIRQDGSIECLGYDSLPIVPSSGTYVQVSSGGQDMPDCAIRNDGGIACWGNDDLGLGNTAPDGCYTQVAGNCAIQCNGTVSCWGCSYAYNGPHLPRVTLSCGPLNGPTGSFTQISYDGLRSHCGIKSDGSIECWWNSYIFVNNIFIPDIVIIPAPTGFYTKVSAGAISCAMRSDETFTCWILVKNDNYDLTVAPILIPNGPYIQIGDWCTLRSDGQVLCWGLYSLLQMRGNNSVYSVATAAPYGPYRQVGNDCGLKSDGTISCWRRQVESGALVERSAPSGSYIQLGNANSASDFNCAITSGDAIICWDWGDTDSSGNERLRLRVAPTGSYTQVNGSGALKDDGTISCWEWDSDDAGVINPNSFSLISTPPGSYTQVTYADGLGCAIKTDGSLSCWGNNAEVIANVPSGSFTQVSTSPSEPGSYNVCALRTDGSVVCWDHYRKKEVSSGFSQVFAGYVNSCAIRRDNSIVCWSDNYCSTFFPASL